MKSLAAPDALISSHPDGIFRCGSYHISLSDEPGSWDLGQNDEFLWAIWKRWNDMKKLFRLYLDSEVSTKYRDCPAVLLPGPIHPIDLPFAKLLDLRKVCVKPGEAVRLAEKDKASYCRFYRALTAHWRASSLFHMAQTFDDFHSPVDGSLPHIKTARSFIQHRDTTLEEVLEIAEVIEFVWGFLGYTILRLHQEGGSEIYRRALEDVPGHMNVSRQDLMQFTAFLQPSDILTLLHDYWGARDKTLHKYVDQAAHFAGKRDIRHRPSAYHEYVMFGFFDALEKHQGSPFPVVMGPGSEFQKPWQRYKPKWFGFGPTWAAEIKGIVFNTESCFREMDFFAKIMGDAIESRLHEEIS